MRLQFLLLDANVVITLLEIGLWDAFLKNNDVFVSQTIIDEVKYYVNKEEQTVAVDWQAYEKQFSAYDTELHELEALCKKFTPDFAERLDAGELSALAFLTNKSDHLMFCSGDKMAIKALVLLEHEDRAISLEAALKENGLTAKLPHACSDRFMKLCIKEAKLDRIQGRGLQGR